MTAIIQNGTDAQDPNFEIRTRDLVKNYGHVRALDNVSIDIQSGTIFGLLGPNGAGKTTLIKVLTALIKPDGGEATVAGYDILRQSNEVKKRIGWVAAEVILDDDLTAMENLWLQAKLQNMKDWKETAKRLLDYFDLSDRAESKVKEFSTGMRKKLEIALALLHSPSVIFMDEPTIGLDPGTRRMLWDLITGINRNYGITVLLTTHYIEEADALCDHLAIINRGKIAAVGTPSELKSRVKGELIEIETASPADASVFGALPGVRDIKSDGNRITVRVDSSEETLPLILSKMNTLSIRKINVEKPSLETVFLDITGTRIDEEAQVDIRKFYANIRRARQ
ncbi:MAG: ATP-binding cassette domain-containing protein [Thermoplasmata archaeon]|nr:ATP-binding cassette domain-containing protein [Candidatus Sysuiplasma jiujiangense]MBX8639185.1 ATP-binding cassette domain-containing protein [Candidatus Sysuiplasma jiujiangense]